MKEMSNSKQMTVNMIAAVVSFVINTGINFILTPILVRELGSDTYGFIGLANNFVQYATIVTVALNSMSGRFISIEYNKGNIENASKYFSSVLIADMFLAAVMLLVSAVVVLNLDSLLQIPPGLESAVKLTFAITFITFILSIVTAIFTTAAFVKNRLYLNSIRDIIGNAIKVIIILVLFSFFPAKLYFLAVASLAAGIFLLAANITVKRKILPDVKMNPKLFDMSYVKTILSSGIWNSITNLSNALNTGLDLLICNLTLGPAPMGLLSISVTVPHCISQLITTLANIFTPRFTILYAKDLKEKLVEEAKYSQKIVSLIMSVPLAGFIAYGVDFYKLWQPTKTHDEVFLIWVLTVLACISYISMCHTRTLYPLFTVCNKLKANVLVSLVIGVVTVGSVLLLIHFTPLGVYAIAGVSSVLLSLKSMIFVPLYASHILNVKKTVFYPTIIRGWICFGVLCGLFYAVSLFFHAKSWLSFLIICLVSGLIGYIISVPLILSKSEVARLKTKLVSKLKKAR